MKARSGPKLATAANLENAALRYLERFASSSGNLRRVLLRKVVLSAQAHGSDAREGERIIDTLIERFLRAGLIDDRSYAEQKALSLRRRGTSRYGIRGKLALKRVAGELIAETLQGLDAQTSESELAAACALVRRRRLGPYRASGVRQHFARKDFAALARAGFGLGIARRVLAQRDGAALEALERGVEES
jgi:regulatory protein